MCFGLDRKVKSIFVLELKQSCIICRHFMNFGDSGFCYRDYYRDNVDNPVVKKGVQSVSAFTNKEIKGVRCVERSEMDKHCPYFEIKEEYVDLLISKERIEHIVVLSCFWLTEKAREVRSLFKV